ncbi:MAG: DUF1343 domain-containing protein [Clostridia bacterium]|nr:DUF1343 domain-containing protein [Clostridia bacterium]
MVEGTRCAADHANDHVKVKLGITKLLEDPGKYLGRMCPGSAHRGSAHRGSAHPGSAHRGRPRVGLVANYNAVDEHARPIIQLLRERSEISLRAIYVAEHGLWGCEQAGVKLGDSVDAFTGAQVFSLYGDTMKPTPEMLSDIDVLVCDGADIGSRYWTCLSTMALCIEAMAQAGKPIIVTDRPNPLGGAAVEGNVLDMEYHSFVGFFRIPIRHGMTPGELARLFAGESDLDADLTIVPMDGWTRDMLFPDTGHFWTATPNMPDFETALLYPGTCLFEGTACSEGRGTTKPFKLIGAPWINAIDLADRLNNMGIDGARFRPAHFRPAFSKHAGEQCQGVEIYITDHGRIRPVHLGLSMLCTMREQRPDLFAWNVPFIDLLSGGADLRTWIDDGSTPEQILSRWRPGMNQFLGVRERYLLYDGSSGAGNRRR